MFTGAKTLNELRTILRAIFNLGKSDGLIDENPITEKTVPIFPVDDVPKYIPPGEDFLHVLKTANLRQRAHLLFIKNTTCRVSSSLRAKWSDVDWDKALIWLRTKKKKGGGEKRYKVAINSELALVLKWLEQNSTSEYLFPTEDGRQQSKYPRYLQALCSKAGVKPFTFHSIRHYTATRLDNARAPRKAIQSILGHDNAKTTDIYLQTLDDVAIRTAELLVGIKKPVDSGGDFGGDFSKLLVHFSAEPSKIESR